ncbi:MAG TPA: hypothetical protein DCE14_08540 [Kosmotogaceae bacterium]|nr:MAG: hypothetical protein XE05_0675 [Thermotogales bacterium 46_20]HAA86374.1 hypothetical protein [Kosmotogaceae bacterium]
MKKLLILMIVVVAITSFAMAAERPTWAGLDTIIYGWPEFNELGQMTKLQGISFLGYNWRTYFNPVQIQQVNFYWEWGIQALVLGVQGGVGLTYPIPLENTILYLDGYINVQWGVLTSLIPIPLPFIGVGIIF